MFLTAPRSVGLVVASPIVGAAMPARFVVACWDREPAPPVMAASVAPARAASVAACDAACVAAVLAPSVATLAASAAPGIGMPAVRVLSATPSGVTPERSPLPAKLPPIDDPIATPKGPRGAPRTPPMTPPRAPSNGSPPPPWAAGLLMCCTGDVLNLLIDCITYLLTFA